MLDRQEQLSHSILRQLIFHAQACWAPLKFTTRESASLWCNPPTLSEHVGCVNHGRAGTGWPT